MVIGHKWNRVFIAVLLILVACAQKPSPHHSDPQFRLQKAFAHTQAVGELAVVEGLLAVFSDEILSSYIEIALANNFSIKMAKDNLRAAGFVVEVDKSSLFPSLDLGGNTARNRNAGGNYHNNYSISLDSSWEIDIWGKLDGQINSSQLDEKIQQEALNDIRQSVVSQTIQGYFNVINTSRLVELFNQELDSFRQTEQSIIEQFSLGLSNGADLDSAKTASYNALLNVETAEKSARDARKQLNILLGSYPSNDIRGAKNYPKLDKMIPSGIPSEVLLRRPDIKSAYLQVVKADNDALVSYKDMFPVLRLTTSLGRSSSALNQLSHGSLTAWSLVANIAQPLFDAGQRKARLGQRAALADAAYQQYQTTILNALAEVEQRLDAESSLQTQLAAAKKSLYHANSAERRISEGYRQGLNNIFDLLNTRRAKYATLRNVENINVQRYQNRVALALALGKAY